MYVSLLPPECHGDTVRFRWLQSEPSPYLHKSAFWIRYDGLDTASFSDQLWMEIWFALVSRVFGQHPEPVTIILPEPIPQQSVDYWLARRSLTGRITVLNTRNRSYRPWRGEPVFQGSRPICLMLGGGKDSLNTLGLLNEIAGPEQLLVTHLFAPFSRGAENARRYAERAERVALGPIARDLGVTIGRITTSYRSNLVKAFREQSKPHLELYSMMSMPLHLAYGVETITITEPYPANRLDTWPDGEVWYKKRNQRPESMRYEAIHFQKVLHEKVRMINAGLPFNSITATWLLLHRYPYLAEYCLTCAQTTRTTQFCYGCEKCAVFGLLALGAGVIPASFDIDAMLANDAYWDAQELPDVATTPRLAHGNAPFSPAPCPDRQFQEVCHTLFCLDLDRVRPLLSEGALRRLTTLKQLYGNVPYPTVMEVPRAVGPWVDHPIVDRILEIAARHFPLVDSFSGPILRGDQPKTFDFSGTWLPLTAHLPHLQD